MKQFSVTDAPWRAVVVLVALCAFAVIGYQMMHSVAPLRQGMTGTLGFSNNWFGEQRGTIVITSVEAGSPVAMLGAVAGDTIVLDRHDMAASSLPVGAPVGLTLLHEGVKNRQTLAAAARPLTTAAKFHYIAGTTERILSVLFALLIAFKQPTSKVYRALALSFLFAGFNEVPMFVPVGTARTIIDLLYWATFIPQAYALCVFAVNYPDGQPAGPRRGLWRCMPALAAMALLSEAYVMWWATGHAAPRMFELTLAALTAVTVVTLLAFWVGWRTSEGDERQRHLWLLFVFGLSTLFNLFTGLPIAWQIDGVKLTTLASHAATIVMETGVIYAVLRHRIFNFSFAVNRAVFYSAASLLLLIAFGIIEKLSEHFLHFEARETNVLIDGAIALGVYLSFHKIRHAFEHALERLFFSKWHRNEAQLRDFTRKAVHITTAAALVDGFEKELRRFSGGASVALYQRSYRGDYACVGADEAPVLGVDDDLCVSLRTDQKALFVADSHDRHGGALALPMAFRGDLPGFVLLGRKDSGEAYRPDEVDALATAAHQVGFDLHALQIDTLTAQLRAHEHAAALDAVRLAEQGRALERLHGVLGVQLNAH